MSQFIVVVLTFRLKYSQAGTFKVSSESGVFTRGNELTFTL